MARPPEHSAGEILGVLAGLSPSILLQIKARVEFLLANSEPKRGIDGGEEELYDALKTRYASLGLKIPPLSVVRKLGQFSDIARTVSTFVTATFRPKSRVERLQTYWIVVGLAVVPSVIYDGSTAVRPRVLPPYRALSRLKHPDWLFDDAFPGYRQGGNARFVMFAVSKVRPASTTGKPRNRHG